MSKQVVYCPFCVDYFENILRHHIDNHEFEFDHCGENNKLYYKSPSLTIPYIQITLEVRKVTKCMPSRHAEFFDNTGDVKVLSVTGGTRRTKKEKRE